MSELLKLSDWLHTANQNKQTKGNLSNLQTRLDLGLNNTPYYEKMDYKGYEYYPSEGKALPFTTNYYEYKGDPYEVLYTDFPNGSRYIYELGDINGINVNIMNRYDKNGIKLYSDTLYNQIPVNTPIGRDLQRRVESYLIGGNMTNNSQSQSDAELISTAFAVATDLKKQGLISEVAGKQIFAQAFQQTPEAAKMFVEAAQKQDVQTIIKLFTKLGIVK